MNKRINGFILLLVIICFMFAGYTYYRTSKLETNVKTAEVNSLKAKDELAKIKNENNQFNVKFEQLKSSMSSNKTIGNRVVTASLLNIRQDAGTDLEPIGTLPLNSSITVIDTSNPLWYKIKLDLSVLNKSKEDNGTVYYSDKNGNEVCRIASKFIENGNLKTGQFYFVSSSFLSDKGLITDNAPDKPQKPFVYGLTFYDDKIASLLKSSIWSSLGNDLKSLGYDGVNVVPVARKTFVDDVNNGKYDAVESSPADFLSANKNKKNLSAFAKTVNKVNNTTDYSGIIIVNKKSGINSFNDLKGKTILTNSTNSESGYIYQKYYLKKFYNIDIDKQCKVITGVNHDEVLLKVARGEADAGFCGDFVMLTDPLYRVKIFADKLGIVLENDDQLKAIRDQVMMLSIDDLNKIPNNPHSIKSSLYEKRDFVNKLKGIVSECYNKNREDFGLTDALSSEYDFLADFE